VAGGREVCARVVGGVPGRDAERRFGLRTYTVSDIPSPAMRQREGEEKGKRAGKLASALRKVQDDRYEASETRRRHL
jgi:hypothetical protein